MIEIIDLTTNEVSPVLREDKINVYAYMLPASAHKSTPFSMAEEQIYEGHSLSDCLTIVKKKLKLADVQLPPSFNRYQ